MTVTPERVVRHLHHDAGERPMIVIWETTRACQLVCKHCRADAQKSAHPDQLTTEQGKALLDDVASFGKPHPIMVLTGGDPFERADLPELVRYGADLGLHMALSPSVTPKMTPESLKVFRDSGVHAISLSLDGARAEVHDGFRGVPGVFDATVQAAAWTKELGYRLQINSTITRDTVEELPDLLRLVHSLGASLWSVFFLVPTGRGSALQTLSAAEAEDVLHWLHDVSDLIAVKTTEAPHYRRVAIQRARMRARAQEGETTSSQVPHGDLYRRLRAATADLLGDATVRRRKPRPPIDVNSGRGFAFISHTGLVYPSGFFPQHCGNVKETPFPEIYRTDPLLVSLRHPEEFHGKCGVCEFNEVCGGSRSHAYAVTGDILGSDPTCVYVPSAMRTVRRPGHAHA
ncbi:TIGR04053 family radical SAM/SPASM domain-containing protein [Austwickia chelonae]|uniref:TIGR04053 family radical SAM/SPASM domain-containing protein n=1 Tax=Austwickia chelonae TaxID=100225 RepID=UPI000E237698|nr:TIGR04053 family radical SAM/SPASM domain-containing protein [Austwickia chelonae]